MITVVARSNTLAPYLKASAQVVSSALKPVAAAVPAAGKFVAQTSGTPSSKSSLYNGLPTGRVSVKTGLTVATQVRYAHTDLQVPDFTDYRRDSVKRSNRKSKDSAEGRKNFTYLIVGGAAVTSAYSAKAMVTQFISSMSASADVLALAKIEIKLGDIPEGKSVTFKWRGKPLFIRHRTGEEIATEESVPVASLRDPQHDKERVQRSEWLIVLGVCTHLGCVPIANAGDYGGYYCPCHGSHYDSSGRIRKGPAPLNLEVPPYIFPDDNTLIVG